MVRPDFSEPDTELTIDLLGETRRVTVIPESPCGQNNLWLCASSG
jgi:hypothetical protein